MTENTESKPDFNAPIQTASIAEVNSIKPTLTEEQNQETWENDAHQAVGIGINYTYNEFEKFLQENIHPNLYMIWNGWNIMSGHNIRFRLSPDMSIHICGVGKCMDNIITPMGYTEDVSEENSYRETRPVKGGYLDAFLHIKEFFNLYNIQSVVQSSIDTEVAETSVEE